LVHWISSEIFQAFLAEYRSELAMKFEYLRSSNTDYIEELYDRYLEDRESVDESWQYFFDGLALGEESAHAKGNGHSSAAPLSNVTHASFDLGNEARVVDLIHAYRNLGHLDAHLDPLSLTKSAHPSLELQAFGLSSGDLDKVFQAGKFIGLGAAKLSDILTRLKSTYSSTIAVEFSHITDRQTREWLQVRMESTGNREALSAQDKKHVHQRLVDAETFERFLHTRYVAQKRFSLEGGESLIPALDRVIEVSAELGCEQIVLGMAHRGRLNVLANIFGKNPELIFTQFEEGFEPDASLGEGDVKYHMGWSSDLPTRSGKSVHLSMAYNPSHLEFVGAVVEGMARTKQRLIGDPGRTRVMPIVIHGDAAFAGQGVVYETLNLAQLPGFATGGTFHVVINNQVGFTTGPEDARSTTYSTDLARMLEVPIFHVNGDDPEAFYWIAKLAVEFRQKFHKDVIVDLICYRKYGHNEGDEPAFTQPLMYKSIKTHSSPRELYSAKLKSEGLLPDAELDEQIAKVIEKLSAAQSKMRAEKTKPLSSAFEGVWKGLRVADSQDVLTHCSTSVAPEKLTKLAEQINVIPQSFKLHPKLQPFFEARLKAVREGKSINWGNGETLAYASLLSEGFAVRITGQDVGRGTFTHRHAVVTDTESGARYVPLAMLGSFEIHNSHLSETGVLGFEYGSSITDPKLLTIWEAQFGDFANGAQVIIDQFLAAGEMKWRRSSGLVLLLPHAYEGQGAEHSSARLERFLQLCAKGNMIVANLSTPAQIFHALRRQMLREFRKPLVIMSPKSLLRHPQAVSSLDEFSKVDFREVLDDPESDPSKVTRVLLCSGKVYYDLRAARGERRDVAIVRVEQLYPWPADAIEATLKRYSSARDWVWVQEEPQNMGAWTYVFSQWNGALGKECGGTPLEARLQGRNIRFVGRIASAAPATGFHHVHEHEQEELLSRAFEMR
jgi:2-oxoglutarate dehydrogenase E1 component